MAFWGVTKAREISDLLFQPFIRNWDFYQKMSVRNKEEKIGIFDGEKLLNGRILFICPNV